MIDVSFPFLVKRFPNDSPPDFGHFGFCTILVVCLGLGSFRPVAVLLSPPSKSVF